MFSRKGSTVKVIKNLRPPLRPAPRPKPLFRFVTIGLYAAIAYKRILPTKRQISKIVTFDIVIGANV